MELSNKQAENIVTEISEAIGRDVFFVNRAGLVTVGTNVDTIGREYSEVKVFIENCRESSCFFTEFRQAPFKAGLLCAVGDGECTIGAICIEGPYREIVPYANLISRMTGMLVREIGRQYGNTESRQRLDSFLAMWLFEDNKESNTNLAVNGFRVGIDINLKRRVLIISADMCSYNNDSEFLLQVRSQIRSLYRKYFPDCLHLWHANREILIISDNTDDCIAKSAGHLLTAASEQYGLDLIVGISAGLTDMHKACVQAEKALNSAVLQFNRVCLYDNMVLELVVTEVPTQVKETYIHRIFPDCDYSEMHEWMRLLWVYFQVDGSIQKASEMLFIHKNTLQYKIKKLEEITRCDVRKPGDVTALYIAMMFFVELRPGLTIGEEWRIGYK